MSVRNSTICAGVLKALYTFHLAVMFYPVQTEKQRYKKALGLLARIHTRLRQTGTKAHMFEQWFLSCVFTNRAKEKFVTTYLLLTGVYISVKFYVGNLFLLNEF